MSYHVLVNREQKGPFSAEEILQKIKNGELAPTDFCWKKGMKEWNPIDKVISLAEEYDLEVDIVDIEEDPSQSNSENNTVEKKREELKQIEDETYELIQSKLKHGFTVFSLFLFFILGIFLAFNDKIMIGILLAGGIAFLLYKTKGRILKRNPRLRIHRVGVDFFVCGKTITVPWNDVSKVLNYDLEFQGHANSGLEFVLINEDYFLNQYPKFYKVISKNINKLVSIFSKEGTSTPFKIDFLGIGKEEEIEPALIIALKYLSRYGTPNEQEAKVVDEEDMETSWVSLTFYGIAFLDFVLSWIGVFFTPYDLSPVLFGAMGFGFDRYVYSRGNLTKLHKNLIGGGALSVALLIILILPPRYDGGEGNGSGFAGLFEDERVTQVKESVYSDLDQSLNIGSAFDKYRYFSETSWESFQDDQDRQVIEFTGTIDLENNHLFKRWQFWMSGPSDEQILEHCEELKKDSPELLLQSGKNLNKSLVMLSMLSVGIVDEILKMYKITGVNGAPEFEVHFVTQFTLSALDDTSERTYEGVKIRCEYEDFDKTVEYSNEDMINQIYQNEEPMVLGNINDIMKLEFLPSRLIKFKKEQKK